MSGIIGSSFGRFSGVIGSEGRIGQVCQAYFTTGLTSQSGDKYLTGWTQRINTDTSMFTVSSNGITITHGGNYIVSIQLLTTTMDTGYRQAGLAHNGGSGAPDTRDDRLYRIDRIHSSGAERFCSPNTKVLDLIAGYTYTIFSGAEATRTINGGSDYSSFGMTYLSN